MRRALSEYEVRGIRTTIPFFQWMLEDADFLAGGSTRGSSIASWASETASRCAPPARTHEDLAAIAVALSRHSPAGGRGRTGAPESMEGTRPAGVAPLIGSRPQSRMKLQLEIADRLRTVEVQRQGTGYLVTVDGHRRLVEAARIAADALSLIVRDEAGGEVRSVEAIVPAHSGNGALDVHIDGYRIPVHLRQGRGRTVA